MTIERAAGDWIGLLFILAAILAQAVNAMRRGKPPAPPEPRAPRPRPQTQAQTQTYSRPAPPRAEAPRSIPAPAPAPAWQPDPLVPPFTPPQPPVIREEPRPRVQVEETDQAETAALQRMLERLRLGKPLEEKAENAPELAAAIETAVESRAPAAGTLRLQALLRNRNEARRAILLSEVLQPPISLRTS